MWLDQVAVRRPLKVHFQHGGMKKPLQGVVLHIQQGHEDGTFSEFNNPAGRKASSHFGNPKKGHLEQFVKISDVAWAQMAGNHRWISVENEGFPGDALTISQIENVANLMAWLHWNEEVPLQVANTPRDFGLGFHAMGGKAWGGHFQCPGKAILNQRQLILARAQSWTNLRTKEWYRSGRTAGWYQWSHAT